jgi:NhaP-type Na+/H+ or K+/H+ antiporter
MIDHSALLALALAFLAYGVWSRWLGRTVLTGPILFTAFGVAVGPLGLGWIDVRPSDEALHFFAEVTLVLVLFSDAAKVDARGLWHEHAWPLRTLAIGLPLVIVAHGAGALLLFPGLGLWEAALLGAMLAATDAALAGSVVDDTRVPQRARVAVNVESGLNDGIALPFVLLFAALAGAPAETPGAVEWLGGAARKLLLGPLAGALVGCAGGWLVGRADRRGWMGERAEGLVALALALASFALAETLGGNGFLAAFVGGLAFRATLGRRCEFLFEFEEVEARTLVLLTFTAFGCVLLPAALPDIGWRHVAYALLALTLLRMVPVALALAGSDAGWRTRLFLGWFGPRGLASLLFLLLVLLEADIEHRETVFAAVTVTVLASVLLHGVTAGPLARWYGGGGRSPDSFSP